MIIVCQWSGYILWSICPCSSPGTDTVIYGWSICPCSSPVTDRLFTDGLSIHVHHLSLTWLFIDGLSVHVRYLSLIRLFTDSPPVHVHHLSLIGLLTDGLSVHQQSIIILSTSGYRYVNDHVVYSWPTHQRPHYLLMSMYQQSCYLLIIYMSTITVSSDGLHVNSHAI